MKRFGLLILAAVLGSVITMGTYKILEAGKEKAFRIENVSAAPVLGASYMVRENGEMVPLDFTEVAKKVMPTVVHIKSTQDQRFGSTPHRDTPNPNQEYFQDEWLRRFFGPEFRFEMPSPGPSGTIPRVGSGSGVIIHEDGYIVTNNHVIDRANDIEVTLDDNRVFKAKVIGTDPSTDLALLQIKESGLPYLPVTNSDDVEVGEWVLAVGNPFNLNSTVTAGIVSAKARNINILQDRGAIESFIQTDAAINPGNSGGALVDLQGGLVGINTAIASTSGTFTGYGFAIPANIVSKVVLDLQQYGMVQRGYLGLMIRSVNASLARDKELNVTKGVYVDSIMTNSAAAEAGVEEGDVILEVDGVPTETSAHLLEIIGRHHPGDEVVLKVIRRGKEADFRVTLRNQEGKEEIYMPESIPVLDKLGIDLEEIDPQTAKDLGVNSGLKVLNFKNGILKRNTDMKPGFIITKVDGKPVAGVDEFTRYLEKAEGGVMLEGVYEDYPGTFYYAFGL